RGFLRPAPVHASQTPLGTSARGPNRFAAYEQENWIRVRRRKYADRNPTALDDRHAEIEILYRSVRHNLFSRHGFSIHHYFHRHSPRGPDTRTLQVPVWLLVVRKFPDCSTGRLYGEIGGGGYRHIRTTGRSQIHLTVVGAHLCAIDCKVHQMASAIGDIGRTLLQSFHKVVIRERSVDFDVCTSPAYSAVGDTWKIG